MEKDDLKLLWKELHSDNPCADESEIKKVINMKHSKIISKILFERKREMIFYISFFILCLILMFYAFVYKEIKFSFISCFVFSFVTMFCFFKVTHAISTFVVLSKETKNISIVDSVKLFSKMLNKIQLIDFSAHVIFFYVLAAILIFVISNEKEIFRNLNLFIPIICVILFILLVPWFLKRLHKKRYEKFFSKVINDE